METYNLFAPVEVKQNMKNLYTILMQYLEKLYHNNHPKIHLITEVLDLLLKLKKEREENVDTEAEDDEEIFKKEFDKIHNRAFKNITEIYDYDKEQDEKNKLVAMD
jgi:hypothetical protein